MTLDTSKAVADDLTITHQIGDNVMTIGVYQNGQFYERVVNESSGHRYEKAISPGEYRRLKFVIDHISG